MNITEEKIIQEFSNRFGDDIYGRLFKLREELGEFSEATLEMKDNKDITPHMIDEAADLYGVALHLVNIVGLNHQSAIEMVHDKIVHRDEDPNYKKEW